MNEYTQLSDWRTSDVERERNSWIRRYAVEHIHFRRLTTWRGLSDFRRWWRGGMTPEEREEASKKFLKIIERDLKWRQHPQTPALAERFGWRFYDMYRQKYPGVSERTRIVEVETRYPEWRYEVPEPQSVYFVDDVKASPYVHFDVHTVRFETWGDGKGLFVRLAYAPHIDTLFIQR